MSHPLISTPQPNFHFSPPKKKMIGPHPIITPKKARCVLAASLLLWTDNFSKIINVMLKLTDQRQSLMDHLSCHPAFHRPQLAFQSWLRQLT